MTAGGFTEPDALTATHRAEYGRCVAALVRRFGDLDLAEESVQDAFATAVERWRQDGPPPNPGGWITTTATRRALDVLRRESTRHTRYASAALVHGTASGVTADDDATPALAAAARSPWGGGNGLPDDPTEEETVPDDRLRLLFACCHPALARPAQVALTLRLLGGLTTPEIARAFLVPEATIAQRIVRAKRKIATARIPFRVPEDADLTDRLRSVLDVVYLVFTEGYDASSGTDLVRDDLCAEAVRLARLLVALMPDEPEAVGLLALVLLVGARREARTGRAGALVLLADQDRSQWDRAAIVEGHALVRECLRRAAAGGARPGPYQVQAAIQAVHTDAPSAEETDWGQVLALYDQLLVVSPTPVVRLNRAVAVGEVHGPAAALAEVDALSGAEGSPRGGPLDGYVPFHVVRADLARRLGRQAEARAAYEAALALTTNDAERRFLIRRRDATGPATPGPL